MIEGINSNAEKKLDTSILLEVKNLSISFKQDDVIVPVVKNISFNLHPGK